MECDGRAAPRGGLPSTGPSDSVRARVCPSSKLALAKAEAANKEDQAETIEQIHAVFRRSLDPKCRLGVEVSGALAAHDHVAVAVVTQPLHPVLGGDAAVHHHRGRERQGDVLRGHRESIGERLKRDLEAMAALPAAPFDTCHQAPGQVSSQSLVRFQTNDYPVPVAYGHRQVWVHSYVEQVVIGCGTEIIARHRRSYQGEDTVFDPPHYLPLIERKIGALDQAAPLAGWELPDAFAG